MFHDQEVLNERLPRNSHLRLGLNPGFAHLVARGASSLSLPLVEVIMKGKLGLIKPKPRTYFDGPPQFK